MKTDPLKNLRIASPCPMNWEQMTGDDRARFCSLCNLHVYNIAELTQKQARDLITKTEGRLCGRIYRRSDGTVITRDCPVGWRAIRRRAAKITGAVFAALVALSSAVFGQKPSPQDEACKQQVSISRKNSDSVDAPLTGKILDPNGAAVPGARVKITERASRKSVKTTSDADGNFRVAKLPAGSYQLVIEYPGFKKLEIPQVPIGAKESVHLAAILIVDSDEVTVGIIADYPMIDTSQPGRTMIITSEMMRRMVIP